MSITKPREVFSLPNVHYASLLIFYFAKNYENDFLLLMQKVIGEKSPCILSQDIQQCHFGNHLYPLYMAQWNF